MRGCYKKAMSVERPAKRRAVSGRRDFLKGVAVAGALAILPEEDALAAPAMGGFAIGPISTPAELGPALTKAIAVVKSGMPALVDVVVQAR